MDDLTRIEQSLSDARDELTAYWEQPDGQACLLALRVVTDALADYRAVDAEAMRKRNPEMCRRIDALADEVARLRAPLDAMI
ncbi:MAG TPA: hypothetical protein VIG44_04990 [Thermomicrobiales bacterium]